jgi:hypothetical protein
MSKRRARLDADRTAEPLTEIREVFDAGNGEMRTLFSGQGKEYVVVSETELLRARVSHLEEAILDALIDWGKVAPDDVRKRLRAAVGRVE